MIAGAIEVLPDGAALARAAATRIAARLGGAPEPLAVALTGGTTSEALYRLLAAPAFRDGIPWSAVHWFWGDERFVAADDPRSNGRMAMHAMLDHVPVRGDRVHRIPTDVADPHEAARRYEATLREFQALRARSAGPALFDLVLMGMGDDGHTASLFPGQAAVEETARWVVGVDHAGMEPHVPRVTLTLPALASTREMLFLVGGAKKRPALERIAHGEPLPAARAHAAGELVWLVDRDAAPG